MGGGTKGISSTNSIFDVELAGEGRWISSSEDTGEYSSLSLTSGEGEDDRGEGGGE